MKEYIFTDYEKARELRTYYNRLCNYFTLLREKVREQIGIDLSEGETLAFWSVQRKEKEIQKPQFMDTHGLIVQKEYIVQHVFAQSKYEESTAEKIAKEYASKAERAEARAKMESFKETAKSLTTRPDIGEYNALTYADHDLKQITLNKQSGRFEWANTLPAFIDERVKIKLTPKGEKARAAFEKAAKALQAVADLVETPQNGHFFELFQIDTNGKVHAHENYNYNEL